jgi:hypothetical protein
MKTDLIKTITILGLLITPCFAAQSHASIRFIPEDSMEYLLPFPDSTALLSVSKEILPLSGGMKNEPEYRKRIRNNYKIHLSGSYLVLEYKIDGKIVRDSLLGYKRSMDTVITLLNQIPNGRFVQSMIDPNEVVIQTKNKYVSCVSCLLNSAGNNIDKLRKIFGILGTIQQNAFKNHR